MSMQKQDSVEKTEEDEKTEGRPGDSSSGKPEQETGETAPSSELLRLKQTQGERQERGRGAAASHDPSSRPLKSGSVGAPSHHRSLGNLKLPKSPASRPVDKPLSVRQLTDIYSQASRLNRPQGCDAADQGRAREVRSPPQGVFFGQSGASLSLFRDKSNSLIPAEEPPAPWVSPRRASEPGLRRLGNALVLDRASALHLELLHREALGGQRLPNDPGVKVSQADSPEAPGGKEPRYCLSPSATKTVRDYFSSHRRSNPQSGQQVALALVQSRREWLRRCSDPMSEPDFDPLLFAEESYV